MKIDMPLMAGFLSSLALIIPIGAQNAFVLRLGIRRQHRLPVALLCAMSDALLIGVGIAGLGALLHAHPGWLTLTRYGGAAFLAVYGLLAARRAFDAGQVELQAAAPLPLATALATCLAFTFLNPHVYLDTVVLLGALASQHGRDGRWFFGLGAALASLSWFLALAYGAGLLAPLFRRPLAWRCLDGAIAAVMIGLAVTLVLG